LVAPPTWIAGQVLTASDVDSWFVPLVGYKTANQSVTSSTALVNDSALAVALAANAYYWFQNFVVYEGGTLNASDIKWAYTVPAGATLTAGTYYRATTAVAVNWNQINATTVSAAGSNGAGNLLVLNASGTVQTGGTAGNLQMQWAQNTSSGTATIVHSGSVLLATRVG
jgi:hypothetical protein